MHGRVLRGCKSCRSLGRSCSQHMRSVLPLAGTDIPVIVACDNCNQSDSSFTASTCTDSFIKDGREVRIGDSALFKLANDSQPFIGLICCLSLDNENNLQLDVNWCYRLSELKLGKGTLLCSAPNEIFYSFQKDIVPAASLLHPCKVAFLPRGVELPIGTSSFICRRAYDVASKSLWWLSDRQFITDRQEEVDRLLNKTRVEMLPTLQPGAHSPKKNNGPTSTSQMKPGSDNGQNDANVPSQAKAKKREKGDHGSDPVKRGHYTQLDAGESLQSKTENNLKYEIAKITEKAGVVDLEVVEKLVQLMQLDTPERKLDLGCRSMLAYVLSSTDNVDCLSRFVHLRGLPVLDSWLQDIHKGKMGDCNILKDGDKPVEEFLQVLLRALENIPVNLQALQTCNIGRSVNHLRSHKNIEIQRKARTLVDTWKKRVEAEMICIDVMSGPTQAGSSWPSKPRLHEVSHGASRTPDGAMKSFVIQSSSAKTSSGRSSPGESGNKCSSSSPGPVKPALGLAFGSESQMRGSEGVTVDSPQTREDRSSSNQSHINGQSVKDDMKRSTSHSTTINKISSTSTRNRKNSVFAVTPASVSHKETNSSSCPAHNSTAMEKSFHSSVTSERVFEGPISDGMSHSLNVKIPNRVRSSAQGGCGDSMEDPIILSSQASCPVQKPKQSDPFSKDNSEASQPNVASDVKTGQKNFPYDEQNTVTAGYEGFNDLPASDKSKSLKLHESSFSPMNALVESCAKYSEATSSLSLDDDVGMNLLASVAAGEISRSDISPNDYTERTTPAVEEVCSGVEPKSKSSPKDYSTEVHDQVSSDGCDGRKHSVVDGCSGYDKFSGDRIYSSTKNIAADSTVIGSNGIVSDEKDSNLVVDHVISKASEESERLNTTCISPLKLTSAEIEAELVGKVIDKDMGQPECGQKPVAEAGGLDKVGEPGEKDAECCMSKLESEKCIQRQSLSCSSSHDLRSHCKIANLENQEIAGHSMPESQCLGSVKQETEKNELREKSTASIRFGNAGKSTYACTGSASSAHSGETDHCEKVKFDLNEGLSDDDVKYDESKTPVSSVPVSHSAFIMVASAAKGTFCPPDDLLRSKVDLGWKGSAATSAFRPAEPRKVVELAVGTSNPCCADSSTSKHGRFPLDIDLNVADERLLEEMTPRVLSLAVESTSVLASNCISLLSEPPGSIQQSFGGLDLDLNMADETNDNVQCSTSSNHRREISLAHVKPVTSLHIQRDFDLNDGPIAVDDGSVRQFPVSRLVMGSVAAQLPSTGFTMSNPGPNSFTSWCSPGNTYSTVAIPSVLPDRGEQSFPVFPHAAPQRSFGPGGVTQFNPDVYRGSVLSSSPAVPFPPGPFQYPVFPFGATFPQPSGTFSVGGSSYQDSSSSARIFPPVNSQYLGSVVNVTPQFQRPFVVGLTDINNIGVMDSSRIWGRQSLDINAGPGIVEGDVKEENFPHSSGQQPVSSFQALAEEQARVFSVSGGILKRREPDGGWDSEPTRHRHSSWQ